MNVRTRFAPSPTGALHAGTVRTALFAWLLARQNKGAFLLRIEDTDQKREVAGSDEGIKDTLQWLGLTWDEGPGVGGPAGEYYQSKRLDLYKEWADKLVASGNAYADPYTPQEIDGFREAAKESKRAFLYRHFRPEQPPVWDGSQPLRLKSTPKTYGWHDEVMGDISMGEEMIDDMILMKSDGFPTYNFAHIVDDYLMGITHVLRSQEFLSSIPKYLNLYEALGITPPKMAILPPVLREDGRKKLGKRDGARELLWYREQGYLPEALLNFMATLGWNDGTTQEIYSVTELIEKFSLERVQKSGAQFDERRLLWLSGTHMRATPVKELYASAASFWPEEANGFEDSYKMEVLSLIQERLKFFAEIPELSWFFFTEPSQDQVKTLLHDERNKQLKKLSNEEKQTLLNAALTSLKASDFQIADLETRLNALLVEQDTKPGILFSLIRIATTGAPASPSLFGTLALLGKEKVLRRLEQSVVL